MQIFIPDRKRYNIIYSFILFFPQSIDQMVSVLAVPKSCVQESIIFSNSTDLLLIWDKRVALQNSKNIYLL